MFLNPRREANACLLLLPAILAFWVFAVLPARADEATVAQTTQQNPSPPPGYAPGEAGYASLRLGVLPLTGAQLVVGLDFTFPKLRLSPSFVTRVDADLFSPFNTRSYTNTPKSRLGVTLNEVYVSDPTMHHGFYAGIGVGPYLLVKPSGVSFGAKLFAGVNLSRLVSIEVGAHFPSADRTILAVEGRVALY